MKSFDRNITKDFFENWAKPAELQACFPNFQRSLKIIFICTCLVGILAFFAGCSGGDYEPYEHELLREEVVSAVQSGRYASALRLLNYLPDFPQADELRSAARYGISREVTMGQIYEAFALEQYEDVLNILDTDPLFNDSRTGFRDRALNAILARDAAIEAQQAETFQMLSGMINEMFQIATLEIETRNMAMTTVVPGGFVNPGTITLVLEFDSNVRLGVANPHEILMHVDDNTVYIQSDTIQISVLESTVSNFEQVQVIRSNPLVSFTAAVQNQIFDAQNALKAEMAERFVNESTIESARRSFMSSLEGFLRGLGFEVAWV